MILIDQGHGGTNLGCRMGNIREKVWTLDMGFRIYNLLTQLGVKCVTTRSYDETTSFGERSVLADLSDCTSVISLHANWNSDPDISGIEFYYWPGNNLTKAFGKAMLRVSPHELRPGRVICADKDRGEWMESPRKVLGAFSQPAVLIEYGMASNKNDLDFLLSENGKTRLALTTVATILEVLV